MLGGGVDDIFSAVQGTNLTRICSFCSGYDKFVEEHQHCLENRKAIVVKINGFRELLLAPVFSIQGAYSLTCAGCKCRYLLAPPLICIVPWPYVAR